MEANPRWRVYKVTRHYVGFHPETNSYVYSAFGTAERVSEVDFPSEEAADDFVRRLRPPYADANWKVEYPVTNRPVGAVVKADDHRPSDEEIEFER